MIESALVVRLNRPIIFNLVSERAIILLQLYVGVPQEMTI